MTLKSTHDWLFDSRPEQPWRPADFLPLATESNGGGDSTAAGQARSVTTLEHDAPINRLRGCVTARERSREETTEDVLFLQAVEEDSNREMDWLWLATKVSSNAQRHYALEHALGINPRSAIAKHGLAQLRRRPDQPLDLS